MKKLFALPITFTLAFALAACGSGNNAAPGEGSTTSSAAESSTAASTVNENKPAFPERAIELIVPFSAGGSTDIGARILAPYVEKELGVPVNIVNKPGGGGWVGWTELVNKKPDGYTLAYINNAGFITGYLDPNQKRKENLESFTLIANHINDPGIIAIRPDETRFTNIQELVEYAKKNELTTTSTGVASDDHLAALKMNKVLGTKFVTVHNKGASEGVSAVLGGHVDLLFANVGDVTNLYKSNQVKVVAIMAEERSEFLPDVPTLKESGFGDIFSGSARGIAGPKGMDPEVVEILRAAFEKAIKNEEQIKKQGESGLQVMYIDKDVYYNFMKNDEKAVIDLMDELGWSKQ